MPSFFVLHGILSGTVICIYHHISHPADECELSAVLDPDGQTSITSDQRRMRIRVLQALHEKSLSYCIV
jgi:hypothetical protein